MFVKMHLPGFFSVGCSEYWFVPSRILRDPKDRTRLLVLILYGLDVHWLQLLLEGNYLPFLRLSNGMSQNATGWLPRDATGCHTNKTISLILKP